MPTYTEQFHNSLSTDHERRNSARAQTSCGERSARDPATFSQRVRDVSSLCLDRALRFSALEIYSCSCRVIKFGELFFLTLAFCLSLGLSECSLPPPDEIQLTPLNPRGPHVQEDVNPHYASPIQTSNHLRSASNCNPLSQFDAPFLSSPFSPGTPRSN